MKLEQGIALAEIDLKGKKKALDELAEVTIPELMEEVGLDIVRTKGGLEVDVTEKIRANITKANLPAALAWLRKNGHDKLIKGKLVITPKDNKHMAQLQKRMAKLDYKADEGVHAQTLGAFVREMLEDGKRIPEKLLGVYRQRRSKITVK